MVVCGVEQWAAPLAAAPCGALLASASHPTTPQQQLHIIIICRRDDSDSDSESATARVHLRVGVYRFSTLLLTDLAAHDVMWVRRVSRWPPLNAARPPCSMACLHMQGHMTGAQEVCTTTATCTAAHNCLSLHALWPPYMHAPVSKRGGCPVCIAFSAPLCRNKKQHWPLLSGAFTLEQQHGYRLPTWLASPCSAN